MKIKELILDAGTDLQIRFRRKRGLCGCGGYLKPGVGCCRYYGSNDYEWDVMTERSMWHSGLGFGQSTLDGPEEAMMSMHLQAHGMTTEEADAMMSQIAA